MVKILGNLHSPDMQQIQMFLAEKKIKIKCEQATCSLTKLENTPELITDDGLKVQEVNAICRFIEEIQQEPYLLGRNAMEKAQIEMWITKIQEELFDFILKPHLRRIPAWKILNQPKVEESFDILNQVFMAKPFLTGEILTFVDIKAFIALNTLIDTKLRPSDELFALQNWYNKISKRESAVQFVERDTICAA